MHRPRSSPPFLAAAALAAALAGCRALPDGGSLADSLTLPAGAAPAADLTGEQKIDVQLSLARALEGRRDWDAAAEAYAAALTECPNHPHALHRLAVVRAAQGRTDEAEDLFGKALAAKPGDADLFADLGYLELLRGRPAAAERNLRQALAIRPEHAAARGNLGLALARTGRSDDALAAFRAAGAGASAGADVAFALAAAGRPDEARARLAAFAKSPDDADRLRELNALLARVAPTAGGGPTGEGRAVILPASAEAPAE